MFGKHANDLKTAKEHENASGSIGRASQLSPSLMRFIPKKPLTILALLALAISVGLNIHYLVSNVSLTEKVTVLTSELQTSKQEASDSLKTLSDEHAKQISELTEKLSAANEVAQAAAIQAAKCLPLMKKYGVKQ